MRGQAAPIKEQTASLKGVFSKKKLLLLMVFCAAIIVTMVLICVFSRKDSEIVRGKMPIEDRTFDTYYGSYTNNTGEILIISQDVENGPIYLENGTTYEGQTIIDWVKGEGKFLINKKKMDTDNGCIVIYNEQDYSREKLTEPKKEFLCNAGTSYLVTDSDGGTVDLGSYNRIFIVSNGEGVNISQAYIKDPLLWDNEGGEGVVDGENGVAGDESGSVE